MPVGNTKSDSNGIAIVASPPTSSQSSTSDDRNPQSETPHSPLPTPHSPSPAHLSIMRYARSEYQNVRVKPLPRAFNPQPLNYDHRILLLAFFTGLPGVFVSLILLWKGSFDTKTQWTLTVFIVVSWLGCALA